MDNFDNILGSSPSTHYARNELCLIERDAPVKKLYLPNVPEDLKKDKLVKHFINFGRVLSVQIFYKVKQPLTRIGFVLFAKTTAAVRALQNNLHKVNGHEIKVLAACSWHQPDIYGASEPLPSWEAQIFKLPDDCLLMIMELLPLVDQLYFQSVCQRFQSVYQLISRIKHKSIDYQILQNLSPCDIREFFHVAGPYFQNFNGSVMQERIFKGRLVKYFQGNFINLKSLDISGAILTEENVFNIFSSTNKLENLILDHCCLTDESLLAFKDLTNLKTLSIACNRSLSGHNLVMLPISIENLNLSFCIRIQPSHVIQMCKSLTNLLELNIVGVDPITNYGNFYNNMIEQNPCVSLQTLGLSTYDQCDGIAKLPNLKNIYIVIVEIPKEVSDTKFFDQLVIFKYEQLEELKIDEAFHITKQMLLQIAKLTGLKTLSLYKANNIDDDVIEAFTNLKKLENIILQNGNFSDSIIVRLVLGCPKLKEVNLVYCLQITRKLLDDIVVKIPIYYKKNERKLPILIFLSDNSYHRCPFMAPAQDIVKIFCYHT